jgi:hypothetical protein
MASRCFLSESERSVCQKRSLSASFRRSDRKAGRHTERELARPPPALVIILLNVEPLAIMVSQIAPRSLPVARSRPCRFRRSQFAREVQAAHDPRRAPRNNWRKWWDLNPGPRKEGRKELHDRFTCSGAACVPRLQRCTAVEESPKVISPAVRLETARGPGILFGMLAEELRSAGGHDPGRKPARLHVAGTQRSPP